MPNSPEAGYDASGNLTCRAASGATTCSGATPTGATLAYGNQGQLAQWLSAPTSPTSSASFLYDGEGNRVQQVATTSGTTTTTSYVGSLEEVVTVSHSPPHADHSSRRHSGQKLNRRSAPHATRRSCAHSISRTTSTSIPHLSFTTMHFATLPCDRSPAS